MIRVKGLLAVLLVIIMVGGAIGCSTPEVTNTTATNERGYANPESLVTAEELSEMEDVVIVDFTDKGGEYLPGAVRITRDEYAREVNGVKGMNISKEQMEALLSKSGIENGDTVVIYDENNNLWSSRLWWAMKVYGHKDARLLDGGLAGWKSAGYETTNEIANPEPTNYVAEEENKNLVADLEMIKKTYDNDDLMVLDTRGDKEWNAGRIPGAVQLEWTNALNEDGTFKDAATLKELYEGAGFTKDKEAIIPHCKSGVRATHSLFVLTELLGYDNVSNYDGSWLEYEKSGEPIEK